MTNSSSSNDDALNKYSREMAGFLFSTHPTIKKKFCQVCELTLQGGIFHICKDGSKDWLDVMRGIK